jgi:hypothetical protein
LKTCIGNGHVSSIDKHNTEAFLEEEGEQGENYCDHNDDDNAEEYNKYNTISA